MESAPFRLGSIEVLTVFLRPRVVGVIAAFGVLLALGHVPAPAVAASVAGFLLLFVGAAHLAGRHMRGTRRQVRAWADGRLRATVEGSTLDVGLAGADVRRLWWGWVVSPTASVHVALPRRALDAASLDRWEQLLAARGALAAAAPGTPTAYTVYSADPTTTLPFDADPRTVLVATSGALVWRIVFLGSLVAWWIDLVTHDMAPVARAAIGVGALSVSVVVCVAQVVAQCRRPETKHQRVQITPDGLYATSPMATSVIPRARIRQVENHRSYVTVRAPRRFVIPATAFRDDEHRAAFVAAAQALIPPAAT